MDNTMLVFPEDFFWGAAISAYQTEGANSNSDWWHWEKEAGKEPSGPACRHYDYYKDDFNIAKELKFNALRLSLEWSRIEPEEGKFSEKEIGHYIEVISSLRERDLEPIVTLHHFTNPVWFSRSGGWLNKKAPGYFQRFVERIVGPLSGKVKYWVTINEPMVYTYHSYILGNWPPQEKSFLKARKAGENLIRAHIAGYQAIHSLYVRAGLDAPCVSIAQNMIAFSPCRATALNRLAVFLRNSKFNLEFLDVLARRKSLDFIGMNYYTRNLVEVYSLTLRGILMDTCRSGHGSLRKNSLGWDIYPEGLFICLAALKKYDLPVFVLENGICTPDDSLRWGFIKEHLVQLHRAIKDGIRVVGYLYWSLLDNFEWDKGFGPRFGLVDVDYRTFKRTIRESARKFAAVSANNALDG